METQLLNRMHFRHSPRPDPNAQPTAVVLEPHG